MTRLFRALPLAAVLLAAAHVAQAQPGLSSVPRIGSSDGWSIKPRGRVQYDVGGLTIPDGIVAPGNGLLAELRRAQLGIEGTAPGGFDYLFEVELAEGTAEITEATVTYEASDSLSVTVGQHNNFQSLEELTSDRFGTFLERAAFTDAFNFERRLGVSATLKAGALTAQIGLFGDNLLEIDDGVAGRSVDARLLYTPRLGDTQLHIGASAHLRDNGDPAVNATSTRYRQRPLIHATDIRFIATPDLPVEEERRLGLEAALIRGPVYGVAEAQWLHADLAGAAPSQTFFGGYAEVGWFLTGETRGYRSGRFDRTEVGRPIHQGGFGAVQIALRYDHIDLEASGRQNVVMASLSWLPTDYLRLMLNYARIDYADAALPAAGGRRDYSVDVLGARAQIDF